MSSPRLALAFVLTLTLAGAPVMQTLAMAASSVPDAAGAHASHGSPPPGAAAWLMHDSHNNACAQHDLCDGACCAACAQCVTGVFPLLLNTDVFHPVLTPSEYRLALRTLAAQHERPPRLLSF